MRTKIAKNVMLGLTVIGLQLCGNARAQIVLQDGSTTSITDVDPTGGTNTVSQNFTVTMGASVLVVSLYDQNNSGVCT